MMSSITVKPYSNLFKDQVCELIFTIQNKEFSMPTSVQSHPDLADISGTYQADNGNFWVALDGEEKVIGTIAVLDIGLFQAALKKLYVAKPYRGKEFQVAPMLLATLYLWCQQRNVREIYLGTTEFFQAAHRFYAKSGFSEVSRDKIPAQFPFTKYQTKFYSYQIK